MKHGEVQHMKETTFPNLPRRIPVFECTILFIEQWYDSHKQTYTGFYHHLCLACVYLKKFGKPNL